VTADTAAVRAATAQDRAAVSGAVAASGQFAGDDLDEVCWRASTQAACG